MNSKRLYIIGLLTILFAALTINSCNEEKKKVYKVGLSQCAFDTFWRLQMNRSIKANAMQRGNIELLMTDGQNSNEKQIEDIKKLVNNNIDLLIVSPNEAAALTEIVSEVYRSGIPVICIDRKITTDDYTCFIGADNTVIGSKAANYLTFVAEGHTRILELHGQKGASATIERGKGFNGTLDSIKDKKYVHTGNLYCEWSKSNAYKQVKKFFENGGTCNVIYSHNDDMAIGAWEAITDLGIDPDTITIIGTDGAAGEDGGIKAVKDGKINATFFYPDGSEEAINTAEKILKGDTVPKTIELNTVQIDANNADGLLGQMTMSRLQEDRIIKQSEQIKAQISKISNYTTIIYCGVAFVAALIVLIAIISRLFYTTKKQTGMLNEKNAEINAQKEELESQAAYLNQINEQLRRSKENTLGSIRYAQTIQQAALPQEQYLNNYFNAFIIYKPKDIVSGDFYWYDNNVEGNTQQHIFGVIDCTGHGVPGAFMSLIGINLLDQIVKQNKVLSPAKILEELNEAIRTSLKQKEIDNNDGMEAVLCKINKTNDDNITLTYEGAKFPVYHYIKAENKIVTYKTARREIGGKFRNIEATVNFEDHTIPVSIGDRIYMSSDGISDQNNDNRKRYTAKRFISTIEESILLDMSDQRDYIWNNLVKFKGDCEQRDDITVMGIEIV